jgi:hypothetical protein
MEKPCESWMEQLSLFHQLLHTFPWESTESGAFFYHLFTIILTLMSCDSSVNVALGYGLDDGGSGVQFPVRAGRFSLHHHVHNGSRAHPASYPMGTRGFLLG